jgi:hypothetical protein
MNPADPLLDLAADLCAATLACQAVAIAWCLALDWLDAARERRGYDAVPMAIRPVPMGTQVQRRLDFHEEREPLFLQRQVMSNIRHDRLRVLHEQFD